jgi:hypothetical protein
MTLFSRVMIKTSLVNIFLVVPAPCRRGESPPEVFFIAMLASGAMSE